jgi:hypothetical protein
MKKLLFVLFAGLRLVLSSGGALAQGVVADGATAGSCLWEIAGVSPSYTLTIRENSQMGSYTGASLIPWHAYRSEIVAVGIGEEVTTVSPYAFSGCSKLTAVIDVKNRDNPICAKSGVLTLKNDILFVPEASMSDYGSANVWKDFGNMQKAKTPLTLGSLTITKDTLTAAHLSFAHNSSATCSGALQGIQTPALKNGKLEALTSITVKYNGDRNLPSSAGKYAVTLSAPEGANFPAATDLSLGTFTINPKAADVSSATVADKLYDGTDAATASNLAFTGTLMGETFTADDDGDGILNMADPDAPRYYLSGGGDTCLPSFRVTVAYGDPDFRLAYADTLTLADGEAFRWESLTPKVVTISNFGSVKSVGAGTASVVGVVTGGWQSRRVVMSGTVEVLARPLTIANTWVDTIKVVDGKANTDAVAGVLQGVLPQDAENLGVTVAAVFDKPLAAGSGKAIFVTYRLTGSRAPCYLPPPSGTLSGTIVDDGSYGDLWGVVMRRDEASGIARPYAGVSVAYSLNGVSAGAEITDACGRYFIGGLGSGDVVVLHPEEKNSWKITPSPKPLTVHDGLVRADTLLYVSDGISLLALAFFDDNGDALARWDCEEIGDATYFELSCGQNTSRIHVAYEMPDNVSGNLEKEASEGQSEEQVEQLDGSHILVDVSQPGRKVFTIALSSEKRYAVVIASPYKFSDLVTEHLGNLRVVINNLQLNDGLQFSSCEWWYKEAGYWQRGTASAEQLYHSAGPNVTDKFRPDDTMRVVLYTVGGDTITTCPSIDVSSESNANGDNGGNDNGNGNGSESSSHAALDNFAYPNPVQGGGKIYLKERLITDGQEHFYSTFRLFTSEGQLVSGGSASVLIEGLTMPNHPGAYYLILDGKAGRKTMQIAVGN